jgi:hypothetical protein
LLVKELDDPDCIVGPWDVVVVDCVVVGVNSLLLFSPPK